MMGRKKVHLGDIAEFINGGAWNQGEYADGGIPVVRVSDISDGTVDMGSCKYLPAEALGRYKKHVLCEGDLIIATVGSHPTQPGSVVGKPAIVPQEADGALLNQNAVCIRSACECLDKKYLGYIGKSAEFRQFVIDHARGSANQVRMSIGLLKMMPISLPPLEAQRQIAGILSAYDDLIENNTRRIRILEEMAQTLYREWFVHFRYPGHEHVPLVESPVGPIPEGWEAKPFTSILESFLGGDWGKDVPDAVHTRRVTVLRGTDISDVATGASIRAPIRFIKESSFVNRRLRLGDVVVENSVNASSRSVGTSL